MLATIGGRIKAMIREEKKLEEIVEAMMADFDAAWGKGFIPPRKFAEMVAMNLIRSAP